MHDEAGTHYLDMIDQTTLGHQYLLQQFGVAPKVGWQIGQRNAQTQTSTGDLALTARDAHNALLLCFSSDPFGHSSTQASLLSAEVGFEALFFGRMDHQDHDARMQSKNMEFIWRASQSQGAEAQVFTGGFVRTQWSDTWRRACNPPRMDNS